MTLPLPPSPALHLAGLSFSDLFRREGLLRLDAVFLQRVQAHDAELHARLLHYRHAQQPFSPLQISELLLACAPLLETVIAELFAIEAEVERLQAQTLAHDPVLYFKKYFVLRRARRRLIKNDVTEPFAALDAWLTQALQAAGLTALDRELATARLGQDLLRDAAANSAAIEQLTRWCILGLSDPVGQAAVRGWTSFKLPQGLDFQHLGIASPSEGPTTRRLEAQRS